MSDGLGGRSGECSLEDRAAEAAGSSQLLDGEALYSGRLVDVRIERPATPTVRWSVARSCATRGVIGIVASRRRARLAGAPAAESVNEPPPPGAPRRAPGRRGRGSRRSPPSASLPRRSGAARGSRQPILTLLLELGFTDERGAPVPGHRPAPSPARRAGRTSASRSFHWPLSGVGAGELYARMQRRLHRAILARAPAERLIALPRSAPLGGEG